MDEVFKALADVSRRRLLDRLNERNGQTLRELCAGLGQTRQSVSKHLAVLEAASLVSTIRQGREKLHFLNAEPINAIADRWMTRYGRPRAVADPPRRLSYTWHTVTPEFVAAYGDDPEFLAKASVESRSKVTFDIEPVGGLVKLTVTHDGFDPKSVVLAGVTQGWPQIVASLRTLLETGEPLALA